MHITKRSFLKSLGMASAFAVLPIFHLASKADPNGTRPTMLTGVTVRSINTKQMTISGRYSLLNGTGIPAMQVEIYAVGDSYFSRWARVYTDKSGNFSLTTNKVPSGTRIQVDVIGNGAYSRPFPTFNRP